MIRIFKVHNSDSLTTEEESAKSSDNFSPYFMHLREEEDNSYYVVIRYPQETDDDFEELYPNQEKYQEIVTSARSVDFVSEDDLNNH